MNDQTVSSSIISFNSVFESFVVVLSFVVLDMYKHSTAKCSIDSGLLGIKKFHRHILGKISFSETICPTFEMFGHECKSLFILCH